MKCTNCGADILEGQVYCEKCGTDVQMVPDYNPLDELLTEQVKGVLYESSRKQKRVTGRMNTARSVRESEAERLAKERMQKKRQAELRKEKARKKRRRLIIVMILLLAAMIAGGVFIYRNSYIGLVNRGNSELTANAYEEAETLFKRAMKKNDKKADAYVGLSEVYIALEELDTAEQMFISAIAEQPENTAIYEAALEFFLSTDQAVKISPLLEECESDDVLAQLSTYVSKPPEFSLSDEEVFDEVQQLSLSSSDGTIYYTTDGTTEPSAEAGQEYTEPIQLEEGTTNIQAISVNKKGIPSLTVSKTYTIELPIQDAPAVTPSTGQYEQSTQIEIRVPEGYTAYYTTDGTPPTEDSIQYTGPIDMPVGNTLFSAVLIDGKGRVSDVTRRNYELTLE
ncbi:MAG: chitobiase/beta-hexosaminidase C-terminal domain-containing protein [Lachnospiraceae bacterium]